ncbi:MAG: hypothetical protein IJH77_06330, partial [Mogibacterium sp.]|nr:hypothetical protein [Mogibacterium sp.]
LALFGINAIGRRLRSHDRYLQYRILAECARVQTYLETACVPCDVSEILPWSLQVQIPWVRYAMGTAVISGEEARYARTKNTPRTVLEPWVLNQKSYHERALRRTKAQLRANDRIVRIALILTILVYVSALVFELRFGGLAAGGPAFSEAANNTIRMWFKIAMGTLSAGTLFTSNYYGKLALPNVIDDHRKMVLLYHEAEKVIERDGETPEILIRLAEDELQENSNWYAYQSMNDADINI